MHKLYKVAFHTLLKRIGPLVSQWSSCSGLLYPEWLTVTYLPNTVDGQPLHIVAAYCLAPTLATSAYGGSLQSTGPTAYSGLQSGQ